MRIRFLVLSLCAVLTAALAAQTSQAPPPTQVGQGRGGGQGAGGGQQPARDAQAQQPATGTGVIAGTVLTEGTGAPGRRARVNLSATELRGARTAMTNDDGAFSFASLPAGRYTLSATKAGYVTITYGAKRPGRPGTPIQLADGQKMQKASLSLPKGAVVTGVVIDEHGEPSPGTQVRVMRAVMRTGEKTYEQSGQDQTDDRGIYRIYGLQPGDYIVNAMPRNANLNEMQQQLREQIESLMQQAQAMNATAGRGGADAGGGPGRAGRGAGFPPGDPLGGRGGRGQALLDQAQALQQQLQQQPEQQAVAYAPVFYPGTTTPGTATTVTLGVGDERGGIDFQLQLVPTARVEGTIQSPEGLQAQGIQISLVPIGDGGAASVPGLGTNSTRVNQGRFQFAAVNPGQYRLTARAPIRAADPAAAPIAAANAAAGRGGQALGPGGRGGPGGQGQITQVLWASRDITVSGQNITDVSLTLQPGMTIRGRVMFDGSNMPPPADLTRIRVNVQPRGQQTGVEFGVPAAQVDSTGNFTITGVAPGKYSLNANIPGEGGGRAGGGGAGGGRAGGAGGVNAPLQWVIRSAATSGGDALDFGLVVEPNQDVAVTLTFVDRNQEISGTISDGTGKPIPDVTIILFPSDKRYWVPQARRIRSSRPGTDGKFSFSGIPPGQYHLTAVTDVEPGEWFNPDFLSQLTGASVAVAVGEAEKKVQDLRVAGGGH
jgi:protocatechuate 3,4-dioxygenase beta subunit